MYNTPEPNSLWAWYARPERAPIIFIKAERTWTGLLMYTVRYSDLPGEKPGGPEWLVSSERFGSIFKPYADPAP